MNLCDIMKIARRGLFLPLSVMTERGPGGEVNYPIFMTGSATILWYTVPHEYPIQPRHRRAVWQTFVSRQQLIR